MFTDQWEILVVDDDRFVQDMIGSILEGSGYSVLKAENGRQALNIAGQHPNIRLIISDIEMSVMNGIEFVKSFREYNTNLPVIILTGMEKITIALEAIRSGADDKIIKDEHIYDTLTISVKNVLEKYELKEKNKKLLEKLQEKNEELKRLSFIDGLTGIPNRRYFNETIEKEWKRAIREKHSISLIMIDIDFFKTFNDTYGHLKGDDCLKLVAQALNQVINRPGDNVFRYGGEEFCAILTPSDLKGALKVAREMRKRVSDLEIPHKRSDISECLTVSIGVGSMIPERVDSFSLLISSVDNALYQAKEEGRNRIKAIGDI